MSINITDDIRSITDLKRNTNTIMGQVHQTGRPIILTVNGKAEAVLLDAGKYQEMVSAFKLMQFLKPAEEEIQAGKTKEAGAFFKKFRNEKNL